ncbi:YdcF family protein [Chitinimonas arctica]|uniref:YdcF family protein n=1 Tax=Chitinimonas arctica TaxID=2594795 RepID=A0A516SIZ5_9NEIS|nr:YdcF family protein [Chitinimonas arctica]QDQ28132.1 YdcF family protein [Chitinimonas arctica]
MAYYFCTADWPCLTQQHRTEFLKDFKLQLESRLGLAEELTLPGSARNEADSATYIWQKSSELEQVRQLFANRAHFIETPPEAYGPKGRDSTHGNATQFLAHFLVDRKIEKGDRLLLCCDTFSAPRAGMIFNGYCERFDLAVVTCSKPLTTCDQKWHASLLAILLREASCLLYDLVQASESASYFDFSPAKKAK